MNILLIRLRLIGDVVFTTPAVSGIRRRFPDARLTYLAEAEAAPIVANNPHLDDVIVAPRTTGIGRIRDDAALARRVRRARFDVVIDFHGGPRALFLTLASGAPKRIGYALPGRSWIYTDRVSRPRALRPRHSVENQWDLLARLDASFGSEPDPLRDPVGMFERPEAVESAAAKLRAAGAHFGDELIVVHVSAGNPFRRWPAESFVDALVALATADGRRRIILTSGPSDVAARDRIGNAARARLAPRLQGAIVPCPELDLPELRAIMARAALFIGGDSGPLHIAATTATPIVGVFGPTLPARSTPWRDPACVTENVEIEGLPCRPCEQRTCAPGDFRCLTTLTWQSVVAAAERALARAAAARQSQTSRVRERSA